MTETGFHLKHHLTSFQIMILGFAGVILLGALVLMLPVSTAGRVWTPFHEALFTSTSAVCVTGLVVQDTGSYWSAFGQAVTILLMLTGGAPGSTAGGMKVTTLAVLVSNAVAAFRRREDPQLFKRRLEPSAVRNAAAILLLYLGLTFAGAAVISAAEGLPLGACLYETASAAGTVGLTLGLTPQLGTLSQGILILLMFFGRVGGLTLIYAAFSGHDLFHTQIGVGNRLDGGRRRVKKYLWSFFRTAPAGQVRL